MQLLDLTLDDAAANLALDEALLERAEADKKSAEVLRFWVPSRPMVVLGRSSPMEREVNLEYCREHEIPVFRRCSGGATIVTGPGCLMYAVRLNYAYREELRMLDAVHRFVMNQLRLAIGRLDLTVRVQGTSDLTFNDRKFSGNSLRCKRNGFVYHGTIICDFDLSLVSKCLGPPMRQPDYRRDRSHAEFLIGLPVRMSALRSMIAEQWQADVEMGDWPQALTYELARDKYQSDAWTTKV